MAEESKKKGCLKGCLTIILIFLLLGILIGACASGDDDKNGDVETNESDTSKQDKNDEATDSEKSAAEKEYYVKEVKSKIDVQMKLYDSAWSELWTPTFEGLGTSVDRYAAYDNMKELKERYDSLYKLFREMEADKLSKENKKLFEEFAEGMGNAAFMRSEAAEKAMKMFDEGDYSPSKMDEIKTDVEYADSQMMTAIVSLTSLESKLGVEREE